MNLDASQLKAIDFAATQPCSIITGGAGTGKTTIIKQIAERLSAEGGHPLLCAFAGKAAARLKEATGIHASTIHRMLGSNGCSFTLGDLHGKSVICDETSMVSSDLLAEIARRNPARLTMVGDPAQLPPVGCGQPFHDLINLRDDIVVELSTCYRATEAVFKAASQVREGLMPAMRDRSIGEKWDIKHTGGAQTTEAAILKWVESGFIDFSQDIILCPRNGGKKGDQEYSTVASLNERIVELVNPRRHGESKPIMAGDRVINTKNLSEKNIWNGTTGEVISIDMDGSYWIELDVPIQNDFTGRPDNSVLLTAAEAKNLQLAYALTVHKAQGSQYRRVIFIALQRDSYALLDRSLIYTAITRAKEQCVVCGELGALREGIRKLRPKRTVIQELATGTHS